MIKLEIIKLRSKMERVIASYTKDNNNSVIKADYSDVVRLLTENGRTKWYFIEYCGRAEDIESEFSLLKISKYAKFFLIISMNNPTMIDVSGLLETVNEINECTEPENEIQIMSDESIDEGVVKMLIVTPEYELGWEFRRFLSDEN